MAHPALEVMASPAPLALRPLATPRHRPRFVSGLVLLLACLFLLAHPLAAQTNLTEYSYGQGNRTRITLTAHFSEAAPYGYLPVRVTIRSALGQTQNWNLRFNASAAGRGNISYSSDFSLPGEANAVTEHDILIPLPTELTRSGYRGLSMQIQITSPGMELYRDYYSQSFNPGWAHIAISDKIAQKNLLGLSNHLQTVNRGSTGGSDRFGSTFKASMLPQDWRGWVGTDAIMITDGEWTSLSPESRRAIMEWLRMGGYLAVYTTRENTSLESLGLGHASARDPEVESSVKDFLQAASISLGRVSLRKWDGSNLNVNQTYQLYARVAGNSAEHFATDYSSYWKLQSDFGEAPFNAALVIILLIAFGVVVGPVNLFVLAKPGQRHRMFLTTPLISLAASLLIVLLILFSDGLGGRGMRFAAINLEADQDERRAYVFQEQISRTGMLLSNTFTTEDIPFISPTVLAASRWTKFGGSDNTEVRYTLNGNQFAGDWFQSRSEQAHYLEAIRPTRSRIEKVQSASAGAGDGANAPELFSSLEFAVDQLFYFDEEGKVWRCENSVASGNRIPLAASSRKAFRDWWEDQTEVASNSLQSVLRNYPETPRDYFFATAAKSGGLAVETLGAIKWEKDRIVIYGPVMNGPVLGSPDAPPSPPTTE